MLVGCGESQQSAPAEVEPAEPVAVATQPEPPTAKAPDISIHSAAFKGNIEAVKQHLAGGTDVNSTTARTKLTPLHMAARSGRKEIAELLVAADADVNAKSNDGRPLESAIRNKNTEIADLLRKHGGKSGAADSIHAAAAVGNIEAVKQHLSAGTDINVKGRLSNETALHYAAEYGHKEVTELLIANGADVNAKSNIDYTPLDSANNKETADLLRKHGGKHSTINTAAQAGDIEAIKEFLSAGSDVNAKDDFDETPLDSARFHPETADPLRKHGGKTGEELKAEGK